MLEFEELYNMQARADAGCEMPSRFVQPDTIDNWRHTRMLDMTRALVKSSPAGTWLTVGDGRFGSDAAYLNLQGVNVTASSLTEASLKVALERGLIPAYRVENAEKLSLPGRSVDFVLCKESYHHFPRPPIALYEMLRVARQAVVLIEPADDRRLLNFVKRILKRALRGDTEMQFEPSGNYLYRVNLRELEQLMLAMGGLTLAYKPMNDFYHPSLARYDAGSLNVGSVLTRLGIGLQNVLCRMRLLGYGLGCYVLFSQAAEKEALAQLHAAGFRIIELPRNPYVAERTD